MSFLLEEHNQELLDIWNHEVAGEELHLTWKESRILRELETILSRLEYDSTSNLKKKREKEGVEPQDAVELSFHRFPAYHLEEGADLTSVDLSSPLLAKTARMPPVTHPPLPKRASALIDSYFSFTHCWFPIVEKHRVLRISYSYSRQPATSTSNSADLSVLWALLAYADTQSTAEVVNSRDAEILQQRTEMTAEDMRTTARNLIPDEQGPFEIGHVQALLLLVLLYIGQNNWSCAWALVGHATRIALELALGTTSSEKRGTSVLYGCFILDTLIAAHLMRPPMLRRQDMEAVVQLEEDGSEEWDPWTSPKAPSLLQREPSFMISNFNRLVDLFTILNDAITDQRTGSVKQLRFQAHADALRDMPSKFPMLLGSHGPPHHIYLQLFHLSTTIVVLRESFEGGAPSDPLARLACEILILLTKYAQNPTFGLAMIPPVLESPVRLACYAAIAARPSFDHLQGLPSYNAFARKMTDHTQAMCTIWPVFAPLTKLWQKELQKAQVGAFSTTNVDEGPGAGNWQTAMDIPLPRYSSASAVFEQSGTTVDLEGFDMPMTGLERSSSFIEQSSMPAGLAIPASDTSPSFQGDDVDAIFHNLAHLDTTDWTSGREQGLQDFGFADETTFQAFCNDPERLASSGGSSFGLLPNNTTVSFWPPPGFFPGRFGEPDPQVQASQILQSLSGNETYSNLPEGVGW